MGKRALFLANDIGSGLGHVRRSLQIARLLFQKKWQIAFVHHHPQTSRHLPPEYLAFRVPLTRDKMIAGLRARISPIHYFPKNGMAQPPYFWEFASLNYQVLRDGYFTPSIVKRRFRKILNITKQFRPDVLIGDGHLLTYFLGKKTGIPVIQIVRYFVNPEQPRFIWWKDSDPGLIVPHATRAFDFLFQQPEKDGSWEASRFLRGDAYLIPGTAKIEPMQSPKPHLFFGYQADSLYDSKMLEKDPKTHTRKIYVTIGGGAVRHHVSEFYRFLLDVFKRQDYQVIISDPHNVLSASPGGDKFPNVNIFRWIESSTVFPNLDVIIHHGGYSTTLESLWWGVPSIVIPFHSEQEGNGRRIQQLQCGELVNIAALPYRPVEFHSYYGDFTMLGGFDFGLDKSQFTQILEKMITGPEYRENARQISSELKAQFDPDKIHDFVDSLC